ncbi:glycosyltransferase family 39 protein [Methanoregula sp.]|uniref:glycosyltransferase family 39 protein n=1 Tax=Methanoregula sp. TaxID=2052170 RepID=UPI002C21223C|nr:glycosyltransferase family 39 protein [Methanoregula sp.]HVP95687.1 glycosyltransferase family 39 protein [Methanoregula sp.]
MAKKKAGREPEKRQDPFRECDLDGGYESPVRTIRDLTFNNIQSIVSKSRYVQSLLLLTVIGIFLRFYDLGFNSLWLDEASTYTISVKSFADIWQVTASGEFNPPLFYWIEHVMLMLGNNEVILRFIPALLGVLTIPLFYLIGKEFLDRNAGLIAAAACAFSPFLIYYSQEARAYMMMLFFVGLATLFFLRAMKSGSLAHWVLFGAFAALAFWAHFYALVLIGALVLFALIEWVPRIRTEIGNLKMLVASIVVFVVLSLPLIIVTLQLFVLRTSLAPTYGIQGLELIPETFVQIAGMNIFVVFLLVALFIIGIIQAFRIERSKGIFLVLITVLTFVISYVLSFKMPMLPRYLIFLSIVFFLGIAVSYHLVYSLWNTRTVVYGFIAVLFIISAPVLAGYYSGYSKEDWRGVSAALEQKAQPGDIVVSVPGYIAQPLDYYYSSSKAQTTEYGATTAGDLDHVLAESGNHTIYFVVTGDISAADPNGDAIQWLKNNATYVGSDVTQGIYLFTRS